MKAKYAVIAFVSVLFFLICQPCLLPNSFPVIADDGVVARLTVEQLYEEFEANEVAADLKYEGKFIEVSGTVDHIGKDLMGTAYVRLYSSRGTLNDLLCFFDEANEYQVAPLVKGQDAIVRGKYTPSINYPVLKQCVVVYPTPPPAPTVPAESEQRDAAGKDDKCFIATAVYGTPAAQEIDILREFRDQVLLDNMLGTKLVHFYYRTSPPIAKIISEHSLLRAPVRELFVNPVVMVLKCSQSLWSEQ
jgi:hypothetical protein